MVDIKITVKSVETTDEGTLVIEMSPYPYARWIQTEALADANVAVQPYGVIMVPEAATFTPGGLTVDVEVKGYIFSVPLVTLMEADAEDQIEFISPYITVADLADVDLTNLQNGQTLIWDSTNNVWVNGSAGVSTLSALTDTTITTPTNGQALIYDSTSEKWVNGSAGGGGGSFIVSVTSETNIDETITFTCNKNYQEITTAFTSGKNIVFDITGDFEGIAYISSKIQLPNNMCMVHAFTESEDALFVLKFMATDETSTLTYTTSPVT